MAKTLKDRIDNFKGGFLCGTGRCDSIRGKRLKATGVAPTPFGEQTRTDANFDLAFDHSLPKRP